ncbi:MAG TPA: hypothetical protein VF607_12235, partial [Verrucomicrobiae bacterium]
YNNGGNGGLELLDNAGANYATVNLNRGSLQLGGAIYRAGAAIGFGTLNLNGVTLQAGVNGMNLITNIPNGFGADFIPTL